MTYALDELRLFVLQEKTEDPQFEPHARTKMEQVLGSLVYICGVLTAFLCKLIMKGTTRSFCHGSENALEMCLEYEYSSKHGLVDL